MTQIELERQMREMRNMKNAEFTVIAKMQYEVKEEIAAVKRQQNELQIQLKKLEQQRIMLANRRFDMEQEWSARIKKFLNDNCTAYRELEIVSDWALIKELRSRGFGGTLINPDKEQKFMTNLNAKLNGTAPED